MTPELSFFDIAAASMLVLGCAALSLAMSLGVSRSLLIAALRMVVQLLLLAVVLRWLFASGSILITLLAMVAMAVFAGLEVFARQSATAGRRWTIAIGAFAMIAAGGIVVLPTLSLLIGAEPWYAPQIALPVFGMVAGSAMTGIALALETFSTAVQRDVRQIEARLCTGETALSAFNGAIRHAIRTGLLPTINAMSAIGLVTIPGMMTGQLLANADPLQAAKYQMLLMFLIAGVSVLGVIGAVYAMAFRLTDERHRVRLDRLSRSAAR